MNTRLRIAGAVVVATFGLALPARAQATEEVTLTASPTEVEFGGAVQLSGTISPPSGGESVAIVDVDTGSALIEAVTDGSGAFAATLRPEHSVRLRAEWKLATSEPVLISVIPELVVRLTNVLLFDRATVSGRVRPALPDSSVEVTLYRSGDPVADRTVNVRDDGTFSSRFRIAHDGTYRAKAVFRHDSFVTVTERSARRVTPLPQLAEGSRSIHVLLLERRLRELRYRILGVDRSFDLRTGDAVLAFHKVQGMLRTKTVTADSWRRLADPFRPRPVSAVPGFHVEVDQTRQVLYLVSGGDIANIVHVSTGAGGATHDGVFHVYRKIAGYSGGGLYYPSYFDGLRATHGWPEVPSYPASHGCVRVPNWTAIWLHDLMPIGTEVRIHH